MVSNRLSEGRNATELLYFLRSMPTNPIPEGVRNHPRALEIHSRQYHEATSNIRREGMRVHGDFVETSCGDELYMLDGHLVVLDRPSQIAGRASTRLIRVISDKLPEYHKTRELVENLNLPLPSYQ